MSNPKRKYVEAIYQKVIRPKYYGEEFYDALPKVIMDIIDTYNTCNGEENALEAR